MKHRLELFSDAILAIIITIMVLDLHTPATGGWKAFIPTLSAIGIYAIGFLLLVTFCTINVCIVARVKGITRAMMWFNFASLFLTSLFPLLIRNLAKHPGDRADTLVFLLAAHLTVQALTLFRIAAHKMHYQTPGFFLVQKEKSHRRRGAIKLVLLLPITWFCPFAGLALFVAITIWNQAVFRC
jgi:uncharacterized membrane protein